MDRPQVTDAPGLTWRPRKDGWEARWQARTDLIRAGYPVKTFRVWAGSVLDDAAMRLIQSECHRLQDEMLVWGRGGLPTGQPLPFDGTLGGLVDCYRTDPDSRYQKIRFATRRNYDSKLKDIKAHHGAERIVDLRTRMVLRWYDEWLTRMGTAAAHDMVGMVRMVISFGASILEDAECERLSAALGKVRLPMGEPRNERLTAEHAIAIRKAAHAAGAHSIALAQALQFECVLRQKDVIGEWVPGNEPGVSLITDGNEKWLRGIRWNEIDANLILRHTTSKKNKAIEIDLKLAPMVMEEFERIGMRPSDGAVIVCEETGMPYRVTRFRRAWRAIADTAGVPRNVWNMDSRAGGISEATDAGAELELVRHAATHSTTAMTARYSRGSADKVAQVLKLRSAHRERSANRGAHGQGENGMTDDD